MTTGSHFYQRFAEAEWFEDDPDWHWWKWGWHPEHGLAVWPTGDNEMDGHPIHAEYLPQVWPAFSPEDTWSPKLLAGSFPTRGNAIDPEWVNAGDLEKVDPQIKQQIMQQVREG